ncbi:MAG TPA: L-aspartate oxidase [Acidimicrobiales bacterium]|nr:L-aspartate oxidase [Acidimicrobiales bacterium]
MTTLEGAGRLPRLLLPALAATAARRAVDVLVVGAGIAGLTVALSLPPALEVEVALKGRGPGAGWGGGAADGSTGAAQGGIAAALATDDAPALHAADTLAAGAGLCDPAAVALLVAEAPAAVAFLEANGLRLDAGAVGPDLTREGGHSRRRVVHAGGDATGREVMRALWGAARARRLRLVEEAFLVDLLCDGEGRVRGALLLERGRPVVVGAGAVVLATGGFGQLYAETTSPAVLTGDGLAAALRAGAEVADLEFVQFHPTAIQLASDPRPLASEALRGEGAVIRDGAGRPVMAGVPRADLAPRDVVSRTMALEMARTGAASLFLDATAIGEQLTARFPSFVAASHRAGVDPRRAWVPVAPALHYVMGGVVSDNAGRSSLPGLYAVGEVAMSGVHGANRLASNSLVEGVVFGRRAAAALADELAPGEQRPPADPRQDDDGLAAVRVARPLLRREASRGAGVLRSAAGLTALLERLAEAARPLPATAGPADLEEANLTLIAQLLGAAALRRGESRGAHFRVEHPFTGVPALRQVLRRQPDGALAVLDRPPERAPAVAVGRGLS